MTIKINSSHSVSKQNFNLTPQGPLSDVQQTQHGMISIFKRTTGKVGTDNHYSFGKITIENGTKLLKVSPDDLIYFCEIRNSQKSIEIELPSSLFKQARQGDRIHFTKDGTSYHLQLASHKTYRAFKNDRISFDKCEKCVQKEFKFSPLEFVYGEDIPEDYCYWGTELGIPVCISPQTKRVLLNQKGTTALDFDSLSFFHSNSCPKVLFHRDTKEQCTIQLAACGKSNIEVLLDRNYLYVDIEHINRESSHDWYVVNDTLPKGHQLFRSVLVPEDGMEIDEDNISANLNDSGILSITIPYKLSIKTESISSQVLIPPPVVSKTKILVRCDAGYPNQLYLRGQGAPFLSWDHGIEMQMVQAPDLWALEFDQTDFQNLKYKVLKNDQIWENGDDHEIEIGQEQEINPKF
jgi:HSP20 family molecular chaperone IbpA